MIHSISTGPIAEEERKVIEYLSQKKFKKVLDLGGVHRPWARPYVTHYADLLQPDTWAKRYPEMLEFEGFWDCVFIQGDLDSAWMWEQIHREGPFDFVICTQLIEHLLNPKQFLTRMAFISNEGFISVPHKLFELKKGVHWDYPFRGALPHRWICTTSGGVFNLYPKLNFIECLKFDSDASTEPIPDLSFWWKTDISVNVIDDSKLDFSDPKEALDFYMMELNNNNVFG